nr:polysaccharide pyruvyl transferase family protein [uncultured Desulfobulbus sp.]
MRILIDNSGYELKNMGDLAMLQVAIQRIHSLFPTAELHVLTTNSERLQHHCPWCTPVPADITIYGRALWHQSWNMLGGIHKLLPPATHFFLISSEDRLRSKFPRLARLWLAHRFKRRNISTEPMDRFLALIASADCVVATGGGYLNDTFAQHAVGVLQLLLLAQHAGCPSFLFGQGLGPIQSPRIKSLCRQVFPRLAFLGLREGRASLPLALALGADKNRLAVTGDDAIELAYAKVPPQLGSSIGINLRMATYSQVGNEVLHQVHEVMHKVSNRLQANLAPIPISLHDEDSDLRSIQQIIGSNESTVDQYDTPEKVILQIGQCRLVVTGSYHAGVFALSQGIPVVGLAKSPYYHDKFHGLSEQFTIGCQVVALNQNDFSEHLEKAILDAWHSAPETRTNLLAQAELQIQAGHQAYTTLQASLR